MSLLDKLRRWTPLLSFQLALGEKNEIGVEIFPLKPDLDNLEMIRFWAFAQARILYEIWFANTPQAFLAIQFLTTILERDFEPETDCLKRARLTQFHYVPRLSEPVDQIAGEYLLHEDDRTIRFSTKPAFDEDPPSPLVMVSGVVLLQYVLDRIKGDARAIQVLSKTARMVISQFALEDWAGEASKERLPKAAFAQAIHPEMKG